MANPARRNVTVLCKVQKATQLDMRLRFELEYTWYMFMVVNVTASGNVGLLKKLVRKPVKVMSKCLT